MRLSLLRTTAILGVTLLTATFAAAQQPGRADAMFEAAAKQERVDGDLKAAIEQYRKIAAQFAKQPEIAAKALLQMGQCQEKLGQAEARKSYERIVREYGEAQQYATAARARLAAMSGQGGGEVRARMLWDKAVELAGTSVSADGRYFCYPDWSTGDLGLRDFVAGQSRRVTDKGGYDKARGEMEQCAISPDGKRIAFNWYRFDKTTAGGGQYELRVIGADGTGERVLLDGKGADWVAPHSWSPDMKWISVQVSYPNKERKLLLVSADGAPARSLLTTSRRVPSSVFFSPDGKWLAFMQSAQSEPLKNNLYLIPADGSAGAATELASDANLLGWTPGGKALLFAREFNNVRSLYLLPVAEGKALGEPQPLHSATGVASWAIGMTAQGFLIYGSSKRTNDVVALPLDSGGGLAGAPRTVMPIEAFGVDGVSVGIRYSPDGKRVLYATSRKTFLVRSIADGSEHTMMPQLAFIGGVEWAADSNSLLVSGADASGKEGVYRVDLHSGAAALLFAEPSVWLFAASPDGKTVFYSKQRAGIVARDLSSGAERSVMDIQDIAADQRFSRDGKSLAVIGRRDIRIMDLATGQVRTIYRQADPDAKTGPIIHGGDWSADGRRFYVLVRLEKPGRTELWVFPTGGGEPARQPLAANYRGLWLAPDGKHLATVKMEIVLQVWALENFLPNK